MMQEQPPEGVGRELYRHRIQADLGHENGLDVFYLCCNQTNKILCALAINKMFLFMIKPHQKLPKGKSR